MSKQPKMTDADNPEWTREDFARAKYGAEIPAAIRKAFGRPTESPLGAKQQVTFRLSPDVLAALKASGKGWQTRADKMLRDALGL